jgi:hypothetical protein
MGMSPNRKHAIRTRRMLKDVISGIANPEGTEE